MAGLVGGERVGAHDPAIDRQPLSRAQRNTRAQHRAVDHHRPFEQRDVEPRRQPDDLEARPGDAHAVGPGVHQPERRRRVNHVRFQPALLQEHLRTVTAQPAHPPARAGAERQAGPVAKAQRQIAVRVGDQLAIDLAGRRARADARARRRAMR